MARAWAALLLCLLLLGRCSAQGEQAAMDALRTAWGVQGWNNQTHYCNWTGVTCLQPNSAVSAIDLAGLPRVGGKIPAAIGNLSSLQYLSLAGNLFFGSIPSELGLLTQLSHIDLSRNYLSGSIPSQLLDAPLTHLNLSFNFLSGSAPAGLAGLPLTTCDLTSNALTNCSAGPIIGVGVCVVSCSASSRPEFTGPCGPNPLTSPSIVSNCTNGTAYVTVVDALDIPGLWSVQETLNLTVNAPVTVTGSIFFESPANISLSAPITLTGDFIIFPETNLTINASTPMQQWITAGGCLSFAGSLILKLLKAPPSPLYVNVSRSECYLTGFSEVTVSKTYKDNPCFTSEVDGDATYIAPTLQVKLKDNDCATKEKRRLIIFGSVFGGIGLLVTICIVVSLGCIRQRQRREGLLIDDQL